MTPNALSLSGSECQALHPHSRAALMSVAAEGQKSSRCNFLGIVSIGLKCIALMEDAAAHEEKCPKVGAKLWMSRTKTLILQFACLQSGCPM